jgi:hypothetical protein
MILFFIINSIGFVSHTQFSTITLIEPKLGRQLTQPLIDLISRFYITCFFLYITMKLYTFYFTWLQLMYISSIFQFS